MQKNANEAPEDRNVKYKQSRYLLDAVRTTL